ncbi:hypothetical protein [Paenarthrobacter nicotinovorans]|uniref:hypothetical protein n=1 Tax=Paenarthrobacter nicotinovorans TaxID=29320 RepID=UPI003D67ECFF
MISLAPVEELGGSKQEFARRLSVPSIEYEDIVYALKGLSTADIDLVLESIDAVREFSFDSLELSLVAAQMIVEEKYEGVASNEIAQAVNDQVVKFAADDAGRSIIAMFAHAAGDLLPLDLLIVYLASDLMGAEAQIASQLSWLIGHGFAERRQGWIRTTRRMATLLGSMDLGSDSSQYVRFLNFCMEKSSGVDQQQTVANLGRFVEQIRVSDQLNGEILRLVELYGREIVYWAGPLGSISFFSEVLKSTEASRSSHIHVHLGDAYRLADQYDLSRGAHEKAISLAATNAQLILARAGSLSARKNDSHRTPEFESLLKSSRSIASNRQGAGKTVAQLLFQRGNILFASSQWDAADAAYRDAASLLDSERSTQASLLIDVWKGLGDVAVHKGSSAAAGRHLSNILDLSARHLIPYIDPRSHAKILQFAGDVTRHQSGLDADRTDSNLLDVAVWWYSRSVEVYDQSGLALGSLISRFRLAQCTLLEEDHGRAGREFFELADEFREMNNPLWTYKAKLMFLLCSDLEGANSHFSETCRNGVNEVLEVAEMSEYQQLWGRLVAVGDGSRPEVSRGFSSLGAHWLAESLRKRNIGSWIGAAY